MLGVQFGIGLSGGGVGACGGEACDYFIGQCEKECGSFAVLEGGLEKGAELFGQGLAGDVADDEIDVVFAIAVEPIKVFDGNKSAVDAEGVVAAFAGPVCQRLMVAFSPADDGAQSLKVRLGLSSRMARRRLKRAVSLWLISGSPVTGECGWRCARRGGGGIGRLR